MLLSHSITPRPFPLVESATSIQVVSDISVLVCIIPFIFFTFLKKIRVKVNKVNHCIGTYCFSILLLIVNYGLYATVMAQEMSGFFFLIVFGSTLLHSLECYSVKAFCIFHGTTCS